MASLFNLQPIPAPHKTRQSWTLVVIVVVAVILGSLAQRAFDLSVHAQVRSGFITLATGITAFWFGVRFGRPGWRILFFLMIAFTIWAVVYVWLHETTGA